MARALDLAIIEFGTDVVEKSAAWEVLIRRLRSVVLADNQGKWDLACLVEELPSERSPNFHSTIVRSLVKTAQLSDSAMGKATLPYTDGYWEIPAPWEVSPRGPFVIGWLPPRPTACP